MSDQLFCDDIGTIIVMGSVVRFDLLVHDTAQRDSQGKPKLVVEKTVIMPIDTFVRTTSRMQKSVDEMLKKGVIKSSMKAATTNVAGVSPKK
jgi:hypothetical protein